MILSLQLEAGTFFHELRWVSSTPPIWVLGTTSIDPATSGNLWQPLATCRPLRTTMETSAVALCQPHVASGRKCGFFYF